MREILADTGLSEMTIWRMRRRGEFPEPVRLSPGRNAWTRPTYDAWKASRPAAARHDDPEAA